MYNFNPNFNYKRVAANVHGIFADSMSNERSDQMKKDVDVNVTLSKEQYHNVVRRLHHFQANNAGVIEDNPDMGNGSVNFAGNIVCTSSIDYGKSSCKHFESKSDLWILDSEASNHMTFHKSYLTNIGSLPYPILISLPNGTK